MEIRFLEEIAIADAAYEVTGDCIEDIFRGAAIGLFEVMVDTKKIMKRIERKISLSSPQIDLLLFDWLCELVYLKDKDGLLFSDFQTTIIQSNGIWTISAVVSGEEIDYQKHDLRSDVKAVTLHQFSVVKEGNRWRARIVLDI